MKKIYGFIGAVLLFFCSDAIQAGTDLNLAAREAFYRNRVKDALLTYEERLASYDSLISTLERQDKAYECIDAMLDYASAQNSLGQYLPALRRYEQVKGRLDSMHDGAQMRWFACKLRCLYGLGQVTMRLGFYSQSVHYFFDLLELCGEGKAVSDAKGKDGADGESAQQFGDSPRIGGSVSDQVLIKESYAVRAYSTLTLLFMNLDQESQAAYYLNRGRQLVLEADSVDRDAMWVYYNNWAGWYYVRNQFDSAVIVMQQAEELIENEEERAIWSYNIGNIYMGIGESDLAKASLNSAISGKSDSSFWGYAHVISLVNLGFLYGLEQEYDLALDYYQRALELAQKIGTRKIEATAYVEMAGLYKAKGGYKRALALYERGVALRDSLFGAEQQEQMNLLSQEYQQKEKAMVLENRDHLFFFDKEKRISRDLFSSKNPLVVEIGFGMGDITWRLAKEHPELSFLAIDVFMQGVVKLLRDAGKAGLDNLLVMRFNAVDALKYMADNDSISGFHIFFPDPWPKKRHHKRRLLNESFIELLASKLEKGGYIYFATDWEEYGNEVLELFGKNENLVNPYNGFAERKEWRLKTKFEEKGLKENRKIYEIWVEKKRSGN